MEYGGLASEFSVRAMMKDGLSQLSVLILLYFLLVML